MARSLATLSIPACTAAADIQAIDSEMAKLEATDLIFSLIGLTFEMQQCVHYGLWSEENIAETEAALT